MKMKIKKPVKVKEFVELEIGECFLLQFGPTNLAITNLCMKIECNNGYNAINLETTELLVFDDFDDVEYVPNVTLTYS